MSAVCPSPNDVTPEGAGRACEISVMLAPEFRLQSGEKLSRPEIALRIHGDVSKPAIVAAGGISAGRKVAERMKPSAGSTDGTVIVAAALKRVSPSSATTMGVALWAR